MTIHEDRRNKWDNLNNIVKAENQPTYKSSESEANASARVGQVSQKQQFKNQLGTQPYENMGQQLAVGNPQRSTRQDERVDSKASSGNLIRKTRGQDSARGTAGVARSSGSYSSPGLRAKPKSKKGTGTRSSVSKKGNPSTKHKSGLGNW